MTILSKSRFLHGLQCQKRLWYEVNRPGEVPPPDAATHEEVHGTPDGLPVVDGLPAGQTGQALGELLAAEPAADSL